MRKKIGVFVFVVAFCFFFAASSDATIVTFDQYVKFSGTPESPTFSATIEDIGLNSVKITMDHPVSTDADIVFSWYFNIVPPIPGGFSSSSFTFQSGVPATGQGPTPGIQVGEDVQQADGDGKYDVVFTWPNSGTGVFGEGLSSIYVATGINAVDFLALSTPVGGQGPYYSAVEQSAWWGQETAPTTVPSVPEPATLALLGSGLIGLVAYSKRKK